MSQYLKAVYEQGVFRPLEPVRLEEHQQVTLVLETTPEAAKERPIWEVAADLARDIPEDQLSAVPTDGAAQHDRYLYAPNKRD